MKVLLLSCNTGAGHNACAKAVQDELTRRGVPCDIRDALSFVSKEASALISQGHVWLYRNMPRLYGEGYSFAEKHRGSLDDESAAYKFLSTGCGRLRACIASQGYTAVISTHLFPAMMLTHIQRQQPMDIVTAFISTDYTASPGYEAIAPDWCFFPDESLRGQFAKPDMPRERVVASGIPVRRVFLERRPEAEAKRLLGIDPAHRHLLVMSGSMGCGPIKQILKRLARRADDDVEISVICGSNRKLSRQLNKSLGDWPNIHIHDYVEEIALFMDSADLYLTKPGGLSVSEAFAKRLPMALLEAVEGCETHNLNFALNLGAAATAEDPRGLAELCAALLGDDARREAMRRSMDEIAGRDAARIVCDRVLGEVDA